jgi:nucleotide-binding universal stress UspA family protein
MPPKDITVFLEQGSAWKERLQYAGRLAAHWQYHLTAAFVVDALELHPYAGSAIGGGLTEMLHNHAARTHAAEAEIRTAFEAMTSQLALKGDRYRSDHGWGEGLMLRARYSGLSIVGSGERLSKPRTSLSFSEDMIFASGRPILLLPEAWSAEHQPRRLVIGWNGSAEATRAVANAMPFLTDAEVVDIVVVPSAGIHTREGFDPGTALVAHPAHYGVAARLHILEGRDAGRTILDFAVQTDADLIVMGAYGHSKFNETIFGGATRFLLRHSELPILLSL